MSCTPYFNGLFRAAPLHKWSVRAVTSMLSLMATRPSLYGFEDQALCCINPVSLSRSARSRSQGITCFGVERGCKTLVIPASISRDPYDALDMKLIEPLIRWNPSLEVVYLDRDCQAISEELGKSLAKCKSLKKVILPDWSDPVAIKNVVLPCKSVTTIDVAHPDVTRKDWGKPEAVQAFCELIEMHPNVQSFRGHINYLREVYVAFQFSRCKHNVALLQSGCVYSGLFHMAWFFGLVFFCHAVGLVLFEVMKKIWPERKGWRDFVWLVCFFGGTAFFSLTDLLRYPIVGRQWTYYAKYAVFLRRRLDPWLHK
jgi:hypothetical protein